MIGVLALALAVAGANVAGGWWLGRRVWVEGGRFLWLQGAGFFLRGAGIFGTAHWVWRRRHRAVEVVAFLFAAAIGQLVGQVALHLREERRERDSN